VNLGDLNTLPDPNPQWVQPTNLVADRVTMYARMQGGAVYMWGLNDYGQLGNGTTTQANTPIRMQALSSTGAPYINATQVAFGGTSVYVLDTTGQVWVAGTNGTGEQLGAGVTVRNDFSTNCLRKDPSTSNLIEAACNKADGWQFMEYWPDAASSNLGNIKFRTNSGTYGPGDAMLCAHVASQFGTVTMQTCNGSANQQWQIEPDGKLYSPTFFTCARSTGAIVTMATCAQGADFFWRTQDNWNLRPVPRPPYSATLGRYPMYTRITTDNRATLLMDENGDVWGAGGNNRGQLTTGTVGSTYNPLLRKFNLPGGIKAADIYVTETNPFGATTGANNGSFSNSFVIGRDGNVYGSGGNNYGQLGNGTYSEYALLSKMNLPAGVIAKSVQSGFGTTVVLSTTGKVYTMGYNANGQLGDGTTNNSFTPSANEYTNQRSTILY
jgi:alpha-tubulin suppressor-like RCC1 family protein